MDVFNHHTQVVDLLQKHFGDHPISGIEIGTQGAGLTKAILLFCPSVFKLYTVDPWNHREGNLFEASHPQEEHDTVKGWAYTALAEYGERVEIMPITSDEAFTKITEPVDFTHIDGDHEIPQVIKDIKNSLLCIKPGGILSGHDYNTVLEAIKKTLTDREIFQGVDQTWWCFL
jgi:hypothetical protein